MMQGMEHLSCEDRLRELGLCRGAEVQERSGISNTSFPLAVPVGWAEALLHDVFRLLQC